MNTARTEKDMKDISNVGEIRVKVHRYRLGQRVPPQHGEMPHDGPLSITTKAAVKSGLSHGTS